MEIETEKIKKILLAEKLENVLRSEVVQRTYHEFREYFEENIELDRKLVKEAIETRILSFSVVEEFEQIAKEFYSDSVKVIATDIDEDNDAVIYVYDKKDDTVKALQCLNSHKCEISLEEALSWTVANYLRYDL